MADHLNREAVEVDVGVAEVVDDDLVVAGAHQLQLDLSLHFGAVGEDRHHVVGQLVGFKREDTALGLMAVCGFLLKSIGQFKVRTRTKEQSQTWGAEGSVSTHL